jgi:muramoyltetrapeptide carboxypeptidase
MTTPPYLQPGDTIAITAPARRISSDEIQKARIVFESWGLTVKLAPNLFSIQNQLAGTDDQRASDFQELLDDDDIKAIMCARGGYGTVRLIDKLDFSHFMLKPKWIVGYSDITVLHSHVNKNLEIETIHATMPINMDGASEVVDASSEALRKCLFGEIPSYTISMSPYNRSGESQGVIAGGNLSILYSLAGTSSDIETTGKILFIEDIDEYLYHVDRMMMNLKRSHKLDNLAGLLVGSFTNMRDNDIPFGKCAEEIIIDTVKEYKYPVVFGMPSGHQPLNMPLIMGREIYIRFDDKVHVTFKEPLPGKGLKRFAPAIKPLIYVVAGFALLYLIYSLLLGRL